MFLPAALLLALAACGARRPEGLGVTDGRLAPCGSKPNCVATRGAAPGRTLPPFRFAGTAAAAQEKLKRLCLGMPRVTLAAERPGYLAFEFRSALFRFVDDVEFLFDEGAKQIHFRSASRVGRSDLGVNRKRMETIARAFAAEGS